MMALPLPTKSPKRKRDDADSPYTSSPAPSSLLVRNLHETHSIDKDDQDRNSPRTDVAGYLCELEIHEDAWGPESKRRIIAADGKLPLHSHTGKDRYTLPIVGDERHGNQSPKLHTNPGEPINHSPQRKKGKVSTSPATSPKAKHDSNPQLDPRRRSKSPPLNSNPEENPFTWSDSEITGHLGTDPDDDGDGINGLGFKPTPAEAWARSEKRKKQIAEWKSREARDARQLRREKRDSAVGATSESSPAKKTSQKKVKFDI